MIQLSYQPALDPFHAVFRLFRLSPIITRIGRLHTDHVRILDFYLTFPFRVGGIRLQQSHRKYRKLGGLYAAPYGDPPDDIVIFNRMEPMQVAAAETLASQGWLLPSQLRLSEIEFSKLPTPSDIARRAESANERDMHLMEFLGILASEYELTGMNGLKNRTGLLEHRYDAV